MFPLLQAAIGLTILSLSDPSETRPVGTVVPLATSAPLAANWVIADGTPVDCAQFPKNSTNICTVDPFHVSGDQKWILNMTGTRVMSNQPRSIRWIVKVIDAK